MDNDNDNDDKFEINYLEDDAYRRLVIFSRFKVNFIRKIRHPIIIRINRNTGEPYYLLLTSKQMPYVFRRTLI